MILGYARVSTTKQDLERQLDALQREGIERERIYVDKKTGTTTKRAGFEQLLEYAREGDVIVVHTLDRIGRSVRDTLNLIHDLRERGIGLRNLADPIRVDTTKPDDPMAELALLMLALFAQMESVYNRERAAHARSVAESKGRRHGRPVSIDPTKIAWARHLREQGDLTMTEIVEKTGISRATIYRRMRTDSDTDGAP
jgi:DNA invertase Pin-like site-specific DNA recombinase